MDTAIWQAYVNGGKYDLLLHRFNLVQLPPEGRHPPRTPVPVEGPSHDRCLMPIVVVLLAVRSTKPAPSSIVVSVVLHQVLSEMGIVAGEIGQAAVTPG